MKRILQNINIIFDLTNEELAVLEQSLKIVTLKKNDMFLEAGTICEQIAFLESGCMRLFFDTPKKEACSDFYFENAVVGSFASFLNKSPSNVNIAAIEPCELLVLSHKSVMELITNYSKLSLLADSIIREQFLKAEKRESSFLVQSPEERFKNLLEEHPKIFKRVPEDVWRKDLGRLMAVGVCGRRGR